MLIKLEFSGQIFENNQNFVKICPVRADLFNSDGLVGRQTDITTLMVAFRDFRANRKTTLEQVTAFEFLGRSQTFCVRVRACLCMYMFFTCLYTCK